MRVVISEVSSDHPPIVLFECAVGTGRGRWIVGQPREGSEYHIELEMPVLSWGEQIFTSDRREPSIAVADDSIVITCLIERVDADGLVMLRLGESVVMAATAGIQAEPGSWIDVRPPALDLYDTNM